MSAEWDVAVGQTLRRVDLHEQYGGRRQGGIGPSRVTPNILLFSDPATGHQHGYYDGWADDGHYLYAGEGQLGDQQMTQGNLAILKHKEDGRALRLFQGSKGNVTYRGEFMLAEDVPWYWDDAPETGDGPLRAVIMFRLKPVDAEKPAGAQAPHTPRSELVVQNVAPEEQHSERHVVNPAKEPITAERREAKLVQAFVRYLQVQGHTVTRQKILPAGELKPLYTDIFDVTRNLLIEAKGTVTREAIRMAIGQLLDYRRHINVDGQRPYMAVLLPAKPRPDLIDLCTDLDIAVIWAEGEDFRSSGIM